MTRAGPGVTLILGPQSRVGMAVNDIARGHRQSFDGKGVRVLPSRIATRQLRGAMRGIPGNDVLRTLFGGPEPNVPTVLSAANILGGPSSAIMSNELFPEAERRLNGAAGILGQFRPRLVLALDPLVDLILRIGSPLLENRVRGMRWDALYELGWPDLVQEVLDAFPASEVFVIAPEAALLRPSDVMDAAFGLRSDVPLGSLRNALLSPIGIAALERLVEAGTDTNQTLMELAVAHGSRPGPAEIEALLGLDPVTQDLLDQRFEEDISSLRSLPRVTLV